MTVIAPVSQEGGLNQGPLAGDLGALQPGQLPGLDVGIDEWRALPVRNTAPQLAKDATAEQGEQLYLFPEYSFEDILLNARRQGSSARVEWGTQLDTDTFGYVLGALGTRRVLAVVENREGFVSNWLAQLFRVRKDEDALEDFTAVCNEMVRDPEDYSVGKSEVQRMLRTLYLGYGIEPQYDSVLYECNDPNKATVDGRDSSYGYAPEGNRHDAQVAPTNSVNITETVQAAFKDDNDPAAVLAYDIGTHMGDLPNEIIMGPEVYTVYRTRFRNYPWSADENGPKVKDLALIRFNDGSTWYEAELPFDLEISPRNIDTFIRYDRQLPDWEVTSILIDGIMSRIKQAQQQRSTTPFTMSNLADLEVGDEINPYTFLDND